MLIQPAMSVYPTANRTETPSREAPGGRPVAVPTDAEAAPAPELQSAVKAAVEASNRVVQSLQSKIEFVTDDSSGQMLIKVIDSSNNELIRQIPSEEMLAISRALDRMQGLLVKSQA